MLESENEQPLGDDARAYYDQLIDKLAAAPEHVRNIQDTWGDPLTEAAAQSSDGRAAYATLNLAGNMGEAESNEAVAAVRDIVANSPPPPGVRVHVTGPAPMTADVNIAGESSMALVLLVTFCVIIVLLLFLVAMNALAVILRRRFERRGLERRPTRVKASRVVTQQAHRANIATTWHALRSSCHGALTPTDR